jgi:hypothetical protein
MKQDRYEEGRFTAGSRGLGTVSQEMVMRRAREIAVINGRTEQQVLSTDIDQAHRELTGEERLEPETTASEALSEDQRWQEVASDTGTRAETVATPDEQTFSEKLVEEGVADAEHDQALEATRESLKRDTQE